MSNPGDQDDTPIASVEQLASHLAVGCKPREDWRIGTEHEKFGFREPGQAQPSWSPPPYQPDGIADLLGAFATDTSSWEPIRDTGQLIGLKGLGAHAGGSISLEPAGQFELSGAPLASLHETEAELRDHAAALRPHASRLGLGFAPLGFHPTATREQMPFMPKSRYAIMRRYMPLVGTRGLDMMLRTCTVQVNLDYASEADMARKLRVSLALQPVATALFANSPFKEGRPNGLLSTRAEVWTDTDNARSGMPRPFFDEGFGFGRYVEWVLDVPMYFVSRDNRLIDVAGGSFRAWMAGRQPGLEGFRPTLGDFDDHLTTAFTDVRIKRFLEMRGADAGSIPMMVAQSALWVGLLYDDAALAAADALVREQPWEAYIAMRAQVPAQGLHGPWAGGTVRDLAARMVAIASDGLASRGIMDAGGQDERRHLSPLLPIVQGAPNQAEHWLERYRGDWAADVTRIFAEAAI
ncbi:glutamate--cysteine ligase [Lichenicola cladoniae]|uniref:Glutamate--cysteine ligase n=1 Tax=Lichenicola cladoniae TaxID=1484109 RepID=A0A6M8HER8_9PROT|nr:glutamate--cysteine ligase [Lichenicola cladoniae]NPD68644.1 glutamate--cysteine ligase [Acetobacteraceae bacterium]QKE88890.1 glutamate--cysteine ligase [Lichenicola cladoniae]